MERVFNWCMWFLVLLTAVVVVAGLGAFLGKMLWAAWVLIVT